MEFDAKGLPADLSLDKTNGQITGRIINAGDYTVTLYAKNALGMAEKTLLIKVGDRIALTPPMGWNSWNCFTDSVDQDEVLKTAQTFKDKGLADHGWTYINIDDTWQGKRGGVFGAIQGNEKFPDIKGLADKIHSMGLKIGIYSTPWARSYSKYTGGSSEDPAPGQKKDSDGYYFGSKSFSRNDAAQWNAWGIDYLKYDWNPNDAEHIDDMESALLTSGRDIVYSISNEAPFDIRAHLAEHANSWRTTGDMHDTWESVSGVISSQAKWAPCGGPGHWNDPDMLVVGYVSCATALHQCRLTPNEQYTHISMWCLLSAPLLIGCDSSKLDDFTLNLLTNDEVLAVDQDPLGKEGLPAIIDGDTQVWAKPLSDGSMAVGLFNMGELPKKVHISWDKLGVSGSQKVRDLWRQKSLGTHRNSFEAEVARHGVVLISIKSADKH